MISSEALRYRMSASTIDHLPDHSHMDFGSAFPILQSAMADRKVVGQLVVAWIELPGPHFQMLVLDLVDEVESHRRRFLTVKQESKIEMESVRFDSEVVQTFDLQLRLVVEGRLVLVAGTGVDFVAVGSTHLIIRMDLKAPTVAIEMLMAFGSALFLLNF